MPFRKKREGRERILVFHKDSLISVTCENKWKFRKGARKVLQFSMGDFNNRVGRDKEHLSQINFL